MEKKRGTYSDHGIICLWKKKRGTYYDLGIIYNDMVDI